jgi:hypothetical protein
MSWITEHQRNWRIALLVVMVVAFMGPWGFDLINVPAEYECSAPNFRIDGDFCGMPISGIRGYLGISGGFISISVSLLTGEFVFPERMYELLIIWLFLFPLLPIISTLLLILRGNNRRLQVFTIFAWVLAIGGGLFFRLIRYPKLFLGVWGIWLYIGLAASALILEIIVLVRKKDSGQRKSEMYCCTRTAAGGISGTLDFRSHLGATRFFLLLTEYPAK